MYKMQRKVLNRPALPGHPECEQEEPEHRAGPTERVQADADGGAAVRRRRRLVALLLLLRLRLVPVALVLQPAQAAAGAAAGEQGQASHSQTVVGRVVEAATGTLRARKKRIKEK